MTGASVVERSQLRPAILAVGDGYDIGHGHDNAVLRRHAARIDDPRLRRAFEAAIGIQQISEESQLEISELQQERAKGKRTGFYGNACSENELAASIYEILRESI